MTITVIANPDLPFGGTSLPLLYGAHLAGDAGQNKLSADFFNFFAIGRKKQHFHMLRSSNSPTLGLRKQFGGNLKKHQGIHRERKSCCLP